MVGIIALVILEVIKRRDTNKRDRAYVNGDNPIVKAIQLSADKQVAAIERDGDRTREMFGRYDVRMGEHERREEEEWRAVRTKTDRLP
jgi:hypothetical protein